MRPNPLISRLLGESVIEEENLVEANADGTVSDGEREQANDLIKGVATKVESEVRKAALKLHKIGGPFRSPAYLQKLFKSATTAINKAQQAEKKKADKPEGEDAEPKAEKCDDEESCDAPPEK